MFFHVVTIIGSIIGGLTLLLTLVASSSAPQQAAGAAIAAAFAVIPYVLARTVQSMDDVKRRTTYRTRVLELLSEMSDAKGGREEREYGSPKGLG